MNYQHIPKVIIMNISDIKGDLYNFTIKLSDGHIYTFDEFDINNILLDIIRNVDTAEHGVSMALLKINYMLDKDINKNLILTNMYHFFNRLKYSMIELINNINLDSILVTENGRFNFYLKELKGDTAILEYLPGE